MLRGTLISMFLILGATPARAHGGDLLGLSSGQLSIGSSQTAGPSSDSSSKNKYARWTLPVQTQAEAARWLLDGQRYTPSAALLSYIRSYRERIISKHEEPPQLSDTQVMVQLLAELD